MKLSVKWLSGLALIALITVAVAGLSGSASADVDGKVYVTNKWSKLTNEPSPPTGRTNASTVYATHTDTATTPSRAIMVDSDKVVITVVDSDLNQTTTATAAGFGIGLNGSSFTNGPGSVAQITGTWLDNTGESVAVTVGGASTTPIVGTDLSKIKVLQNGTTTVVTGVNVTQIINNGDGGAQAPIVALQWAVTSAPTYTGLVDITYPTSAIETTTVTVTSVVDPTGTIITLSEVDSTGAAARNTGRYEGEVQVRQQTSTLTQSGSGFVVTTGGVITVKYKDAKSAGGTAVTRSTSVAVDTAAPTASITAPTIAETSSKRPTFGGSVSDTQSGLKINQLGLYIDQNDDASNSGAVITNADTTEPTSATEVLTQGTKESIDMTALSDGASAWTFSRTPTVDLPTGVTGTRNHTVDFQIRAVDLAGNIGYSDANTSTTAGVNTHLAHTIKIDEVKPTVSAAQTGTTYDSTTKADSTSVFSARSVKVTFDGKLDASSVAGSDFEVKESTTSLVRGVDSVLVVDNVVYLTLDADMPTNNTPTVKLAAGGEVKDLAGNSASDLGTTTATDKMPPVITFSVDKTLTKDKVVVTIESTETLAGPPTVALHVKDTATAQSSGAGITAGTNKWTREVSDTGSIGDRAIVVTGTDTATNNGTSGKYTTKTHRFDNNLPAPTTSPSGTTTEDAPFVIVDFGAAGETATVSITEAKFNSAVVTMVPSSDSKKFFYKAADVVSGSNKFEWKAVDAAGNTQNGNFSFTKNDRTQFSIELFAGWNAVSIPSDPVDSSIAAVLSNTGIKQVVAYDATSPAAPWRIASQSGGVWTSQTTPGVTNVVAGKGYWIETSDFENQKVLLTGPSTTTEGGRPRPTTIPTAAGWNFVGVVDQSRVKTQSTDWNAVLKTVSSYLNGVNYKRVYTFNATSSNWTELTSASNVQVGQGLWIFVTTQADGSTPPIAP